jgi:hypothetical protein
VLISGGLMLLGAGLMWAVAIRRERRMPGEAAGVAKPPGAAVASPRARAKTTVAAAQAQTGKGTDHQRQS